MTAPGNDALLITALAAFTACLGYVAGRLHQWYRTVLDRDEAYRDGYDTATRSVFSLAARLIGPRRADRGTAVVPPVGGGARPGPSVDRPAAASPSAVAPSAVAPPPAGLRPSGFASPSGSAGSAASAAPSPASSFPGAASSSGRFGSPSPSPPSSGSSSLAGEAAADDGGGRHFVPDELVKAPTYRLTPDRVARAKVRQATPEDDESPETTRLPSVPRPRAR